MTDLITRLRGNQTARHLCGLAADEIERLQAVVEAYQEGFRIAKYLRENGKKLPMAPHGCRVCGIGGDGQPVGYACSRNDCPTRAS